MVSNLIFKEFYTDCFFVFVLLPDFVSNAVVAELGCTFFLLLELLFTTAAPAFVHPFMVRLLEITVGHRTLSDQIFENVRRIVQDDYVIWHFEN